MARNVALKILRGIKANIPVLQAGEFYFATDEQQVYIGSSSGNLLVLGNTLGIGSGPAGQGVTTRKLGSGSGPATPTAIVQYAKIVIGGIVYWLPLFQ